ncbi:MAG: BREX-1 system adenine-specific DNA-methyltransferase PglX [Ignavibacterium sp.]|nr:BREX-1 system adenine-specific DNA-methyltransferase PglX [Ignavibacterium sp.]
MISKNRFTELLRSFQFVQLFNELGWDYLEKNIELNIDNEIFRLEAVAEKRGFVIFVCSTNADSSIPNSQTRRKIDSQISKLFFEHLIIYSDNCNQQIWQLVIRETNKPIINREVIYFVHQAPELLYQKLSALFVPLENEEKISLVDISSNVREQFNTNAERVTKRFYDEFKKHHTSFLNFIKGIEDNVNKEWYASLMLNRLMFIYFIQKKGFLDNNPNYLHNKLNEVQKKKGKDKFYSFYRNFLLVLFHKGLGSPERNEELIKEIGKVPYLNGGLFDVHEIEKNNNDIQIPDEAFEKIFNFFDEYNWHLDTKITATGKDINPDVIGYIFEKYINDRAKLGAYYTKEDITEYISKNTIIPFLFDRVKEEVVNAFREDSSLWKLLRDNPDRYIYDAVKYGVKLTEEEFNSDINTDDPSHPLWKDLPDEIKDGFRPDLKDKIVVADDRPHLWEIRKPWTKPAPQDIALPTEIYRELIERRKRYFDIRRKLVKGEIKEINDFITYNLNIRQFAQDAVEQYEGSDFINAFYKAITKITVLDPTCGSGAFLFAALNILEPLYYACIQRMKGFVEIDSSNKKYSNFRKILDDINKHPNEQYFIYKSIILNNLYGVDIMKEAVEIAKLRLFLKLVAEVDEFDHLEPLPDIDFNVRAGNTLIGYANKKEIDELEGLFVTTKMKEKLFEECELVSKAFKRFKEIQVEGYDDKKEFSEAKKELNERLNKLKTELDIILHKQHYEGIEYNHWLSTHKPFHWFAEFYEIITENGGFDVIIGNPPYVEYSQVRNEYTIKNYETESCGNLYGFVLEKCSKLLKEKCWSSFIIPITLVGTEAYQDLRKLLLDKTNYFLNLSADAHPSILFENVTIRLTILISKNVKKSIVHTSIYKKFYSAERNLLFSNINYFQHTRTKQKIFKLFNQIENVIIDKIESQNLTLNNLIIDRSSYFLIYHSTPSFFVKALNFYPIYKKNNHNNHSSGFNHLYCSEEKVLNMLLCIMNSNLFYWNWLIKSDCRSIKNSDIMNFILFNTKKNLGTNKFDVLSQKLMLSYKVNSKMRIYNYKSGRIEYQEFYPRLSKPIIDEIDTVLAEHYGFTEEELDFIINYDIKYRMGKEKEEE